MRSCKPLNHIPHNLPFPSHHTHSPTPTYTKTSLPHYPRSSIIIIIIIIIIMAPSTTEQPPTWPQLLGSNNWEGLLDPLHPDLRNLILRCGDFIQATYDAFNNDKNSLYCGSSRYGKPSFFRKVMLDEPDNYAVACFLYATARVSVPEAFLLHSLSRESWDRESNWIGYIAVTSDEVTKELNRREIYVVWRGTTRDLEWIDVFGAAPESATGLLSAKSLRYVWISLVN